MTESLREFGNFLKGLNIGDMVIGLIISSSVSSFVTELINEFVKPFTDRLIVKNDAELTFFGNKINISKLLNRFIAVLTSLLIAFIFYRTTKK